MSKRHFPSFIQAFLDHTKHVGAPEKFLLWSAISGVAAALERKTWVVYNGVQVIYPNMYIMLIADSGIAKKTTATKPIMEIIGEIDGIQKMSTQMSGASLVEQLSQAGQNKAFKFNDVVYRNSSLFAFSSEAKVTIGGKAGLEGVQELLTDLYDCGRTNIWSEKNAWDKQTMSGGKVEIFNPCLNLLACSTPAWLNESIGKSGIEGGFASRCIFINQKDRVEGSGWLDEGEVDTQAETNKRALVQDLTQISQLQGRYLVAKGWKDLYNKLQREVNEQIDKGGEMRSYYSRKMWHLIKLAQILAADQSDELVLTPAHLEFANELLKSVEPDMYSSFNNQGENKQLGGLILVWEIMRRRAQWEKQSLMSATYKHANANQLNDHLIHLIGMGRIRYVPGANGKNLYEVIDKKPLGG